MSAAEETLAKINEIFNNGRKSMGMSCKNTSENNFNPNDPDVINTFKNMFGEGASNPFNDIFGGK